MKHTCGMCKGKFDLNEFPPVMHQNFTMFCTEKCYPKYIKYKMTGRTIVEMNRLRN